MGVSPIHAALLVSCAGCSFHSLEPLLCPERDPACAPDAAAAGDAAPSDGASERDARLPEADAGCAECEDASAPGEVELYHASDSPADAPDSQIRLSFALRNLGRDPIPLSELTVRYYFTTESGGEQEYQCTSIINGSFECAAVTSRNEVASGAMTNRLIEWGFTEAAGELAGDGTMTGEVKGLIRNADFSDFEMSNDYSFAEAKDPALNERMTVYRNGSLVWGTPP
jgi:endoglucanase